VFLSAHCRQASIGFATHTAFDYRLPMRCLRSVGFLLALAMCASARAHDIPNLFIVDGSSLVTSTRGQPTMTIQALAFRAADRISHLAKSRSI